MLSIEQLKTALMSKKNNKDYRLILTQEGNFELVPFETEEDAINFDNMEYVTRWGTFDIGNDYVGNNYVLDKDLEDIMEWAIEAWKIFTIDRCTKIVNLSS